MGQTTPDAIRYPEPADPLANGAVAIRQLADDVQRVTAAATAARAALPTGYIGEATSSSSVTLADASSVFEVPGTRVTAPTKTTARRYRVTVRSGANMASGTNGLYSVRALRGDGGATPSTTALTTGGQAQVMVTLTGGPGQVHAVSVAYASVAANVSATFAVGVRRQAGGSATDTAVGGWLLLEDMGAA